MRAKNFILLTLLAFMVAWIFVPTGGHGYDVYAFARWAVFIRQNGLGHAYELPNLDYNPLYIELLWLFGRLQGTPAHIESTFFTFKLVVLAFDFAAAYLTAYMLKINGRNIFLACFVLFNLAYLYNTLFWGQVDSIFCFFIAFAIFLSVQDRLLASLVCLVLAVNFKLQAVVFIPLVLFLNFNAMRADKRRFLRVLPIVLGLQTLILLPFLNMTKLRAIIKVNQDQWRASSTLAPSGCNLWCLIHGEPAASLPSATHVLGLPLRTWGVVLFALAAAVVLVPVFRELVLKRRTLTHRHVFLASSLYALTFFFFMTGMHERYSHPAVLFMGIFAVLSGSYFGLLAISVAYFLNLEIAFAYLHLNTYDTVIFKRGFIAAIFLIVLVTGTFKLYRELFDPRIRPIA